MLPVPSRKCSLRRSVSDHILSAARNPPDGYSPGPGSVHGYLRFEVRLLLQPMPHSSSGFPSSEVLCRSVRRRVHKHSLLPQASAHILPEEASETASHYAADSSWTARSMLFLFHTWPRLLPARCKIR